MTPLSFNLRLFLDHLAKHGATLDPHAAMVISGVAFRHYFFTPNENHAWLVEYPGQYWREDSLGVENYGMHEALMGHTGWSIRRWNALKGKELVALLRIEQQEGRWLRIQPSSTHPFGFIEDFEASRAGLTMTVRHGEHEATLAHPDLASLDDFAAELPELLTLRKEPGEIPASRRHALTGDVLRWAVAHYESRKEIIYEADAFYATGWRAWEELQALVVSLHTETLDDRDNARGLAFVQAHLQELALARDAAAAFFHDPALVFEHTGRQAVHAASLDALGDAWAQAAASMRTAADVVSNAEASAIALQAAAQADAEAFRALKRFNG